MSDSSAAANAQQGEKSIEDIIKRWKTWRQRMIQTIAQNNNIETNNSSSSMTTHRAAATLAMSAGSATDISQLPPPMMPLSPTPVIVHSRIHAGSHTNRHTSMPTFPHIATPKLPNPRRRSESSTEIIPRTMGPPEKMPMRQRQCILSRMVQKAEAISSVPTVAPPRVRSSRTMAAAQSMPLLSSGQHPIVPSTLNPCQDLVSPPSPTRNPSPASTGFVQATAAPVTLPTNDSNYLFMVTITNGAYTGRCLSHQRLLSLPKSMKIVDLFLLMGILFHYERTTSWGLVHINIDCPGAWKEPVHSRYRKGRLLCDHSKTMRGPHQTIGDLDDPDYAGYVLWVVLRIHDRDGVDDQGNVKFKRRTEDVSHLMQLIGRSTGPPGKLSCLGGTGEPSEDGVLPPFVAEHSNDRLAECFGEEVWRFNSEDALVL